MTFVLDNTVSMRWCFGDGKPSELAYAARVLDELRTATALVPAIWALETANVLARAESKGLISQDRSTAFIALLCDLRIEFDQATAGHALTDTLALARRHHLSSYDAAYLELAFRRQLPVATLDVDLRKAVRRAGIKLF